MPDTPYKTGPDALNGLSSLDEDTRRHLHGLLERHTEGLIILAIQLMLLIFIVAAFPTWTLQSRSGLVKFAWLLYLFFLVAWPLRSVREIRSALVRTFDPAALRAGSVYSRYCEGAWFLRTIAGIIGASLLLGNILYYAP